MISLATTDTPPKTYFNIIDCLKSGRLGRGKYVTLLEERAKKYFGVKHCIAVANGTLADILMLATLKVMNPGKTEVILPAHTFIAQANAVLWAGLKPVFVDTDSRGGFAPDEEEVKKLINKETLCYFPVHLLGTGGLRCFDPGVPILEDCCEAMGGEWFDGKKFGTFGIAGAFSMYPSHTITTGEGGLIITNSAQFANICRSIHNHGKSGSDFDFNYVGINAKMTNLQAAIGCELIETIDKVNEKRRRNVALYNEILGYEFYASAPHCFPVLFRNMGHRDYALDILATQGIEARKLMGCIPESKPFKDSFGGDIEKYPKAQYLANCGLFLPIHQNLKKREIERICDVLPR